MSDEERLASPLLEVDSLSKTFASRGARTLAVDGVSFVVETGTTLGLVGESGSGKSTIGRLVTRLLKPDAGTIRFAGEDIGRARGALLRRIRSRCHMVFQDPVSSLDPTWDVATSIEEPLRARDRLTGSGSAEIRRRRVRDLLELVHLPSSAGWRRPHQLSGGQCQRVAIARSIACNPELVVLDEPTSALDVSVQAQILRLLDELQRELGLTYIFISHDLDVVRLLADEIAVMRHGRIVEKGPADSITETSVHPYTRQLIRLMRNPVAIGSVTAAEE